MYKMLVKIKCDVFISLKEEKKRSIVTFFSALDKKMN